MLGVIRFGQEYGLLTTNRHGDYFRVNGSTIEALDRHVVEQSRLKMRNRHSHPHLAPAAKPHVHVQVRKKSLGCAQ